MARDSIAQVRADMEEGLDEIKQLILASREAPAKAKEPVKRCADSVRTKVDKDVFIFTLEGLDRDYNYKCKQSSMFGPAILALAKDKAALKKLEAFLD